MSNPFRAAVVLRAQRVLARLRRPEVLIFLPAVTLAGFWLGGERLLVGLALALPILFAVLGPTDPPPRLGFAEDGPPETRVMALMDQILGRMAETGRSTACFVVQFDDLHSVMDRHGRAAQAEVIARVTDRIRGALRVGDMVAPLQGGTVAVVLAPVRRLDLETLIQLATRLQEAVTEPISLGGAQLYVTCAVGFCAAGRAPEPTGRSMLDSAQSASDEALRQGPNAIRAFSAEMAQKRRDRDALRDSLEEALESGDIRPHFQPQISTDTGEISGFEALARWQHPERGCLMPAEFLPAIEGSDLSDRLGEVMLFQSLNALATWERDGILVPAVSVNFSPAELRNPRLPDRIKWELDRFDLKPDRLIIEILETVIASSENDVIVANIAALAAMGCGIDLDDFGTGHASITTIRRFAVRRLKIDRSFVTRVDQDREQQKMISAIVSLADQLGLQTLAEGVETAAEHAMLAQLGCGHVQGYGFSRPMPLEAATAWIREHRSGQARLPRIGVRR